MTDSDTAINDLKIPDGLPTEIVLHILASAAATSNRFCLSLCLVSSWTRRLALPHLYHTVTLKDEQKAELFRHSIRSPFVRLQDGDPLPGSLIRNLWVGPNVLAPLQTLSTCPHLECLATTNESLNIITLETSLFNFLIKISGSPSYVPRCPPHLTITSLENHIIGVELSPDGFFSRVTHIHMTDGSIAHFPIRIFPRLTHLAVTLTLRYNELHANAPYFPDPIPPGDVMLVAVAVVVKDENVFRSNRFLTWLQERRMECDFKLYAILRGKRRTRIQWMQGIYGESIWDRAIRNNNQLLESGELP